MMEEEEEGERSNNNNANASSSWCGARAIQTETATCGPACRADRGRITSSALWAAGAAGAAG